MAVTIKEYVFPGNNPDITAGLAVYVDAVAAIPFAVKLNDVAFAPPDHATVNPEDVIEENVRLVGAEGAGGGGPVVVAVNDAEEAEPPLLTAVTTIAYAVLTVNPANVAEEEVEEDGVEAEPFKVYV